MQKKGMSGEEIVLCFWAAHWLTHLSYLFLAKIKEIDNSTLLARLEKLKEDINNES